MFRREWRQQLLVLVLLTIVVAAAIFAATLAYNASPSRDAQFGSANARVQLIEADVSKRASDIETLERWFGPVEVIGHRYVPVPGSVDRVELRAQEPSGRYSAPMLRVRKGHAPTRSDEIALTDQVARTFGVGIGDRFELDGTQWNVVGLVENPGNLHDEFALVSPRSADSSESFTVLLDASPAERTRAPGERLPGQLQRRDAGEQTAAVALVFSMAAVVMLLVCLVAAAGFVVVAQRRLRQLGLFAAVGATDKHLRLVLLANGVAVGAVAAVIGAVLGLAAWLIAAPRLEAPVSMRLDRTNIPLTLVGAGMLLAIVTATAAAWWPAHSVSRMTIVQALSSRLPRPKPAHRSAVAAIVCFAVGFAGLAFGVDAARDRANVMLILGGLASLVAGIVLVSPLALRVLAAAATRFPVAVRLALRDLGRYQARAGAALAAISLGLAISVAIVVIATASEYTAGEGNLSDRQILVHAGENALPVPATGDTDLARSRATVEQIASRLDHATVFGLDVAVDPKATDQAPDGRVVQHVAVLGRPVGSHTIRSVGVLYVATPEVARFLGIDLGRVAPSTDVVTPQRGTLYIVDVGRKRPQSLPDRSIVHVDAGRYSSAPRHLITADALRRYGLETRRVGWFLQSASPLTNAQLGAARRAAADAGLTIETRSQQQGLRSLRTGATVAGMLLALAILAMTVGLIRSEAGRDLRTLIATGATTTTRRAVTATTAGALAFAGAVLGITAAYLALIAGYLDDLGALHSIPLMSLTATAAGVPCAAAIAGWLLAGREQMSLARPPAE
jgi:putative ABC transport system permease protein